MPALRCMRSALLAACLASAASVSSKAAGTGTGLVVVVDPGLQLSCANSILFTPTAQEIAQLVAGVASVSGDVAKTSATTSVSTSGTSGTWNATITGLQTAVPSFRLLQEALDICTVSAIGFRIGNYVVSAQLTANTLLQGPSGSQVRVTQVLTRPSFSTGAYAASFSVNWLPLFLTYGGTFGVDFQVEFDLASASRSGLHSSATPGVIRVTAASP